MTIRIGIDLGGTKIEGVALDEHGAILARQRVATPRDYDATIAAITSLVDAIERAAASQQRHGRASASRAPFNRTVSSRTRIRPG